MLRKGEILKCWKLINVYRVQLSKIQSKLKLMIVLKRYKNEKEKGRERETERKREKVGE